MSTEKSAGVKAVAAPTGTRIAAYLLTEYLERIGVDVIFGLCGHTIIAFLDALGKSRIRFITTRHEQVAAHAADGYARVSGKVGVLLTHLGPGLTNAATGVANAALDSIPMVVIAGDVPVVLLRPAPAPGGQPPPGRRPVPDLRAVLQARLPRRPPARPAAHDRAGVPPGADRPARARAGRRPDGHLLGRPADRRVRQGAGRDRRSRPWTPATVERDRRRAGLRRAAGAVRRRRRRQRARRRRAGGAGRGARGADRPHPDGHQRGPVRSSAAARHDRLLGHADRERHVPRRPT